MIPIFFLLNDFYEEYEVPYGISTKKKLRLSKK